MTVMVEGAVALEAVAVSHVSLGITVNGTLLPFPIAFNWKLCNAGACAPPACLEKFRLLVDRVRTWLFDTYRFTGMVVTCDVPDVPMMTFVM